MSDRPALLGGEPIRPQGPPPWPPRDPTVEAALLRAWADGSWGQYQAGHVDRLKAEIARRWNVGHVLACASGTYAVELGLLALGVQPGDEVLMAAYDYPPNFLTLHALGARPVLVDLHPDDYQLDVDRLDAAVSPATRAVLASHLHGGLVAMDRLRAWADSRGLKVLEDAAQCPGALVAGRPAGTWGDAGVLSFGGSKLLSAGRGGALLTASAEVHQRARLHLLRGGNVVCPLSEIQAALLLPQVETLAVRNEERLRAVRWLEAELLPSPSGTPGGEGLGVRGEGTLGEAGKSITTADTDPLTPTLSPGVPRERERRRSPLTPTLSPGVPRERERREAPLRRFANRPGDVPAFYKVGWLFDAQTFGLSRKVFVAAMRAEGIAFDESFRPLHLGRSTSRYRAGGSLVVATRAADVVLTLHHPVLLSGPQALVEVVAAVRKVLAHASDLA